jgi:cytochrome c
VKRTMPAIVLIFLVAAAALLALAAARPAAATPDKETDCSACHGGGAYRGTTTAAPSATYPAAGAAYTVAIGTPQNPLGSYNTGYWIADSTAAGATGTSTGVFDGALSTTHSYTAAMTAPAAEGVYYYKVFAEDGPKATTSYTNFAVFSITVDKTAPVTTDNHDAAIHRSFSLALSPTDAVSGVTTTQYRVDGGGWRTGTQVRMGTAHKRGAPYYKPGTHTIEYRSTDGAGNVETIKSCQVKLG